MVEGEGQQTKETTSLIIATILREKGITGVHTHFRELCRYLESKGSPATLVTPFSWGRPLIKPVFGSRYLLERCSGAASVWWYRHWHEVFLYRALRRRLSNLGDCVIYAQCPVSARAAMAARQGPNQRVVMAVHFRISQSDEWVDKGQIHRNGRMFHDIRSLERQVIPLADGLVYVSEWGRDALLSWLPEAATVPSAVIKNFVASLPVKGRREPVGDLVTVGNLEAVKNHGFMLQVLAEAKRAGRVYTLDIFGEGPLRKHLEQQIRTLGLERQVRLRGFQINVRESLLAYRVNVHASYSESLPLAIIEAMAAGLPIVAGDTGGISELVDEGIEGRFWPLDDPISAAKVLVDLMDSESDLSTSAAAALARFRRDFDALVVAPRLLSFLKGSPVAATGDQAAS